MFKVQLRDAANRDTIHVNALFLPFIPADGKEIRVRRRFNDTKAVAYRVVDHVYEIVEEDSGQSGAVVFVTPIRN